MSAPRRHILPPQTTPLERAVDQTVPDWDGLADAVTPAAIRIDAQFTPWLAVDWGVAQFAPYFDTPAALLAAALPWLRERGNVASVRTGLGWVGWTQVYLDEQGPWLHIDQGRVIDPRELLPVVHVVRASIPAHVNFHRVFHGYDQRPVRTDGPMRLDAGLLDDDSGVFVAVDPWGDPIKLSQGTRTSGISAAPPGLAHERAAHLLTHTSKVTHTTHPQLDAWRLDGRVLATTSGGDTLIHTGRSDALPRIAPLWALPTPARTSACPWRAPPAQRARTLRHAGRTVRPHENARAWTGRWDGSPWRPYFSASVTYQPRTPED